MKTVALSGSPALKEWIPWRIACSPPPGRGPMYGTPIEDQPVTIGAREIPAGPEAAGVKVAASPS